MVAIIEGTVRHDATDQLFSDVDVSALLSIIWGVDVSALFSIIWGVDVTGLEEVITEVESVFETLGLKAEPKLVGLRVEHEIQHSSQ